MSITTVHTICDPTNKGCGKHITKGDVCFHTDHYTKHINCLQPSMQQTAKTNLSCTYVAMDAPQYGRIELRRATALDIRKHAKINQIQGYSTKKSKNDSGFFSPTFSSSQRAASFTAAKDEKPNNEAFDLELHTATSAQASLQVTSSSANTASSITDIMVEIEKLTLSFFDEENPPSITEAEKAIANYREEATAKPTKKDFILARLIEFPAQDKILELAEQRTEEPHNNLLYLIHLVAHPNMPKTAIQVIKDSLERSNASWKNSLENYSDSHGEDYREALQKLCANLDTLISIRLAAQ